MTLQVGCHRVPWQASASCVFRMGSHHKAAVAATVVGEYPLDGHTTFRDPDVGSFAGTLLGCGLFHL